MSWWEVTLLLFVAGICSFCVGFTVSFFVAYWVNNR